MSSQPSQEQMDEALKLLSGLASLKEKDPKAFEETVKSLGLSDLLNQSGQNFDLNKLSSSIKENKNGDVNSDFLKNFKVNKNQPEVIIKILYYNIKY